MEAVRETDVTDERILRATRYGAKLARSQLQMQMDSKERLDTKIGILMGFVGLIIVLSWSLYPMVQREVFLLSVLCLLLSIGSLIRGYSTKRWNIPPNLDTVINRIKEKKWSREKLEGTILMRIAGATNENEGQLRALSKALNAALQWLLLGLMLLAASRLLYDLSLLGF